MGKNISPMDPMATHRGYLTPFTAGIFLVGGWFPTCEKCSLLNRIGFPPIQMAESDLLGKSGRKK